MPQSDAGSGQDAPNVVSDAIVVAPDTRYDGMLVPNVDHWDFYAFDVTEPTPLAASLVGAATCIGVFFGPNGFPLATACETADGATFYASHAAAAGRYYLRVGAGLGQATAYTFLVALATEAPHPILPSDPMNAGTDPTCGTGVPVTQNGGKENGIVFAATKTGFRAVIAWRTELPALETITIGIDGGDPTTVSDATPRLDHIFILDDMPVGRTLCFTAGDGVPRAMLLRNAMTMFDGTTHTVNMVLTAAENVRGRDILEAGLDIFAEKLYDSTDGWVRAGQLLLLSHPEHANTGTYTCFSASGITGADLPNCDTRVDVTFSHDSCAGGAACATLDGIQRPDEFIMMNSVFDANPVLTDLLFGANEVGTVLVHEFGHYAFGGADLYVSGDCYNAALSLSIMGGSRSVTEFDDEVHRCPNEGSLSNYIPTWTRMRFRFPQIPDRVGDINEGPHGGGAAYERTLLALTPTVDGVEDTRLPEDDAGTGGDAGNSVGTATPIEAGVLYDGALALTGDRDVYRFEVAPMQSFEAVLYPGGSCFAVTYANGASVPGAPCTTDGLSARVARVAAAGGPLFIHVAPGTQMVYKVGVGLGGAAPAWP